MVQVAIAAVGMDMEKGEESRGLCKSLADRSLWKELFGMCCTRDKSE